MRNPLTHLTPREVHLFAIGVWYGIDAAVKLATGRPRAARRVFNETREYVKDDEQQKDRPDLLAGFIRNAWYMLGGFVVGFLAAGLVLGTLGAGYAARLGLL